VRCGTGGWLAGRRKRGVGRAGDAQGCSPGSLRH